jgi:hypothetical protein
VRNSEWRAVDGRLLGAWRAGATVFLVCGPGCADPQIAESAKKVPHHAVGGLAQVGCKYTVVSFWLVGRIGVIGREVRTVLLGRGPACGDPRRWLRAGAQITESGIKPRIGLAGGWRKVSGSKHLYLNGCLSVGGVYLSWRAFGVREFWPRMVREFFRQERLIVGPQGSGGKKSGHWSCHGLPYSLAGLGLRCKPYFLVSRFFNLAMLAAMACRSSGWGK